MGSKSAAKIPVRLRTDYRRTPGEHIVIMQFRVFHIPRSCISISLHNFCNYVSYSKHGLALFSLLTQVRSFTTRGPDRDNFARTVHISQLELGSRISDLVRDSSYGDSARGQKKRGDRSWDFVRGFCRCTSRGRMPDNRNDSSSGQTAC